MARLRIFKPESMSRIQQRTSLALAGLIALLGGCAGLDNESAKTCPLHHLSMEKQLVQMRSGTGTFEYFKAREAGFPNASTVYSGEMLPGNGNEWSQTFVCPECQKAESKWFREQRLFRR